jgi:MFS family permease
MQPDLRFGNALFGLGKGIFFLGYFLFEVPSNLMLARFGARRWICGIMLAWGVIAMAMLFATTPALFCALRFLLGLAEAGFFPGVVLYLTYWYTPSERAQIVALFMTGIPVSSLIGSPISGALLGMKSFGMHGWQWLFVLEGLPAVLLGFVVLFYLPDRPATARWLSSGEREWMEERLAASRRESPGHESLGIIMRQPVVWMLIGIYFLEHTCAYGVTMWQPQILKSLGRLSDLQVGLLSAGPAIAGAVGMVLIARSSDRSGERRMHVAGSALTACIGLALAGFAHSLPVAIVALSLASIGLNGVYGPFWAMPTAMLAGAGAAAGIAAINSIGNLGGFVGSYLPGAVEAHTHSFSYGLYVLALAMFCGAAIAAAIPRPGKARPVVERGPA